MAAWWIAAIPAESIQFIGVAVLIADTGYELYAACETITDLDQLYGGLGMADKTPDDAMHSVCDPELPDAGEVWGGVVEKSGEWWEQARGADDDNDIGRESVTFVCVHSPILPVTDY